MLVGVHSDPPQADWFPDEKLGIYDRARSERFCNPALGGTGSTLVMVHLKQRRIVERLLWVRRS
jgi:hypothetical protein